jgi:hypothetical protein
MYVLMDFTSEEQGCVAHTYYSDINKILLYRFTVNKIRENLLQTVSNCVNCVYLYFKSCCLKNKYESQIFIFLFLLLTTGIFYCLCSFQAKKLWASVLWIRIRKDPKLFAGSGSVTRGYGSGFGSETGLKFY